MKIMANGEATAASQQAASHPHTLCVHDDYFGWIDKGVSMECACFVFLCRARGQRFVNVGSARAITERKIHTATHPVIQSALLFIFRIGLANRLTERPLNLCCMPHTAAWVWCSNETTRPPRKRILINLFVSYLRFTVVVVIMMFIKMWTPHRQFKPADGWTDGQTDGWMSCFHLYIYIELLCYIWWKQTMIYRPEKKIWKFTRISTFVRFDSPRGDSTY